MTARLQSLPRGDVRLLPGLFSHRFALNRAYLASLSPEHLLQNFYLEAGMRQWPVHAADLARQTDPHQGRHWGWEAPSCQVRGQFLGHWLSASAQIFAAIGDAELKLRADAIVGELAACQAKNGGEWCAAIPEKYMRWLAEGTPTWAPQYGHHKTLMGLHHMYVFAGSQQALDIADRFADWFHRWSDDFTRDHLDDILDVETGGMLEAWADLYADTGDRKYLDLMERYTRRRLFDPLVEGRDVLTNYHANTTIPEAHGVARCYEVTGDERWRSMAEAYWKCAVTDRGTFCTGGQTSGEIWTPPFAFAARRGDKNQEHCTVYNMIRLAEYLFRWTGEAVYADYIERNLYNGILAQQHPGTGMITYFLPLEAGAHKTWGHPTCDFWCCHGTLVQAHAMHNSLIYYAEADGDSDALRVAQYIPSEVTAKVGGAKVTLRQDFDPRTGRIDEPSAAGSAWQGAVGRPRSWAIRITVHCDAPASFSLKPRLPAWLSGPAKVWINGEPAPAEADASGFATVRRTWQDDVVCLELPKALRAEPIPDEPSTVAFLDGPVVLAGLCDREVPLAGDASDAGSILVPDNAREWGLWLSGYRTVGQAGAAVRFKPLHEVVDEAYTLYFPIRPT